MQDITIHPVALGIAIIQVVIYFAVLMLVVGTILLSINWVANRIIDTFDGSHRND